MAKVTFQDFMTQFQSLCGQYLISPDIALENERVRKIFKRSDIEGFKSADIEALKQALQEEF